MLGHVLCGVLADRGHEVAATWHSAPCPDDLPGQPALIGPQDLTASDTVDRVLAAAQPAVIVNCAGLIKQRAGQTDMAAMIALNALLPHRLAAACTKAGVRLIQISTDCVFSGQRGHYAETDPPDADDAYGLSKLLGEVAAPHLTLRTSLVGWQRGDATDSLLGWFWSQRGLQAKGYTRAYFSGLSTPAFSRLLADIIERHPKLSGMYHVAAERISKHDLLAGLNRRLGHPVSLRPDASLVIDRSLDGRRFRAETGLTAPAWDQMLDELQQERMCRDAD